MSDRSTAAYAIITLVVVTALVFLWRWIVWGTIAKRRDRERGSRIDVGYGPPE